MNEITIIGTGPAGLTAAIYAARAGHTPVVFTGIQHGGQLTTTTEVENFPGFANPILGPMLMQEMTEQARRVGAVIVSKDVTKVDFSTPTFKLWADGSEAVLSKTVIIATGSTAKTLALPHEEALMGRGISTCATCDGFFYKNKTVVVVGGGDSAMEESMYLAKLCKEVYVVNRRNEFRASAIMLARAQKLANLRFVTPFITKEVLHDGRGVTGVVLESAHTQEVHSIPCDGLFYAIGHKPNSEVFLPYVDLDRNGYIQVNNFTHTKTSGVFAAGDIADPHFRQAITAAGMGCQAAMQAVRYLAG